MVSGKETVWKRIWRHWDAEQKKHQGQRQSWRPLKRTEGLNLWQKNYVCEKKSCCQKTRRTWRLQENRGCPKHFRTDWDWPKHGLRQWRKVWDRLQGFQIRLGKSFPWKTGRMDCVSGKRECRSVLLVLFTNPDQMSQQMRSGCVLRPETQWSCGEAVMRSIPTKQSYRWSRPDFAKPDYPRIWSYL